MKKTTLIVSILLIEASCIIAQSVSPEVISSAGNRFDIPGLSLEWTLGEPATLSHESSGLQLTQGFHQPNYMLMLDLQSINLDLGEINVFPNPSQGIVYADLQLNDKVQLEFDLLTVDGTILISSTQTIKNGIIEFDLSKYPNGTYVLLIRSSNDKKQSSSIIQKINNQ